MKTENIQAQHFNEIIDVYEAHYDDRFSRLYRERYLYKPLFKGIDFTGKNVLEAMCGSGQTTGYLLERKAQVTGLDISPKAIQRFSERWPTCKSLSASILETGFSDNFFDCVVIIGGLHHIPDELEKAIREIGRILKPGGYFCFGEPHSGALLNKFRRFWYKHDDLFTDTEYAIDLDMLIDRYHDMFEVHHICYIGNIAYLLVNNSMVFRIPPRWKAFYSPLLIQAEALLNPFMNKTTACFALCQLKKR